MITHDDKLWIFENFRRDHNLPKFRPPPPKPERRTKFEGSDSDLEMAEDYSHAINVARQFVQNGSFQVSSSFTSGSISTRGTPAQTINLVTHAGNDIVEVHQRPGVWDRVRSWFRNDRTSLPPPPPPPPLPALTIPEFFQAMKNTAEELRVVNERASGYEAAMLRAVQGGQTALLETLRKGLVATRAETQLLAMGLAKFVTEERTVAFVKKCPKGLRLDWVANFTSVIPDDLLAKKLAADERGAFDNYAVMHYDPEAKSWAETEAETAARKDPILFGLIEGRRRLYYVGDWVNEFCDLTLDQVADTLGKGAISEIPREPLP